MKVSIILFVAFAAAACLAETRAQEPALPQACPTNPFQQLLLKGGVKMLDKPALPSGPSCGEEWKKFGVCCGEASLLRHAQRDTQGILAAAKAVSAAIYKLRDSAGQIHSYAWQLTPEEVSQLPAVPRAIFEFVRSEANNNFIQQIQKLFAEGDLNATMQRCWARIATTRSGALCSVCSGRSDAFFQGSKVLLLDSDCKSILEECASSFNTMVQGMKLLAELFESYAPPSQKSSPIYTVIATLLSAVLDKIQQEHVLALFSRYLSPQADEPQSKTAANLCSKFLNIENRTFVKKTRVILKLASLDLPLAYVKLVTHTTITQRNLAEQSNKHPASGLFSFLKALRPKSAKRLLMDFGIAAPSNFNPQTVPLPNFGPAAPVPQNKLSSPDTLFLGDVSVVAKNVDSSYTSYFGANGTTVSMPVHGIPLNITRAFP